MFTQPLSSYNILDQTSNSIFFEKPRRIEIDKEAKTRSSTSYKIETLIQELKEKGPLIAVGEIGPSCYAEAPFKLNGKFCGKDIYGWKPGATRKNASTQSSLLILGAKKIEEREYVYFTLSQDMTLNQSSYIRQHQPSIIDDKIYVVSHKTFRNYLFDLFPCTSSSMTSERSYVQKLSLMPLESILDRGKGEAECKAIGQQAFDEFKKKAQGNSWAGKEAVQKICESLVFIAQDGALRKQYVERAWDGIGDNNWRWMA